MYKDPENHRANARRWYWKNKDKRESYVEDNRVFYSMYSHLYQLAFPEKTSVTRVKYAKNNPDKINAKKAMRRARELGATIGNKKDIDAVYARARELQKRGWREIHVHHKIPLVPNGAHSADNLQILTGFDHRAIHSNPSHKPIVVF